MLIFHFAIVSLLGARRICPTVGGLQLPSIGPITSGLPPSV